MTEDGFHEMTAELEVRDETKDTRGHVPVAQLWPLQSRRSDYLWTCMGTAAPDGCGMLAVA